MLNKEASTEHINQKDSYDKFIAFPKKLMLYFEKRSNQIEKGFTFISNAFHALKDSTVLSELRASIKLIIWMLVIGYALKGGALLMIEATLHGWSAVLEECFNTYSGVVLSFLPFVVLCLGFALGIRISVIVLKRWYEYLPLTSGEHYMLIEQLSSWGIEGKHIKSGFTYNWDEVLDEILRRYVQSDSKTDKKLYKEAYMAIRKHYNYLSTHVILGLMPD